MPPRRAARAKNSKTPSNKAVATTNEPLDPSQSTVTHTLTFSSLPDDVLMCIMSLSLAECFYSCSRTSLLPLRERPSCRSPAISCKHAVGFCTDKKILAASKQCIASLAAVNRRLRVVLRPLLFRVVTISDGKPRLGKPSFSGCIGYRKEVDAKAEAAIACKAKVDALCTRPYLFLHVRAVVINSLERWDQYTADHGMESRGRKKFISSLQELYGSIQDLLGKMTGAQIFWSDSCDISPYVLQITQRQTSLALTKWSYYQCADAPLDVPGVWALVGDDANGQDTLSACRSLTLSDLTHVLRSHNGVASQKESLPSILTKVARVSFEQITHLSLIDHFCTMAEMLATLSAIPHVSDTPVFPALCSLRMESVPSTFFPIDKHQQVVMQCAGFLRAHRAIEEFWLHHDLLITGYREREGLQKIGRALFGNAFEPTATFTCSDILLPNLLRFSGELETACALVLCPTPVPGAGKARRKLTDFRFCLDERDATIRYDLADRLLLSLAEPTSNRLIDLHFSLTLGNHRFYGSTLETDAFHILPKICKNLPESTRGMIMVVKLPPFGTLRLQVEVMENIKRALFPSLKNLRSVEIVLCTPDTSAALDDGPVKMITFDGSRPRQINIPHPVLVAEGSSTVQIPSSQVRDRDLLRVRGHPCLERVKILTEGDWVWSDQHGWEYCL